MNRGAGLLVALACALLGGCTRSEEPPPGDAQDSTPVAASPAPPPAAWQVRHDGIGPVRIGATVAELSAALSTRLTRADSLDTRCDYVRAPEVIPGVWFMVVEGRIARLDIDSAGPPTVEGARVGDDTASVRRLYAPRVVVTPHKYTDGQYFTVTPTAPADTGFRLVFEADGGRVTHYRAGRLPEVRWVEGCS